MNLTLSEAMEYPYFAAERKTIALKIFYADCTFTPKFYEKWKVTSIQLIKRQLNKKKAKLIPADKK